MSQQRIATDFTVATNFRKMCVMPDHSKYAVNADQLSIEGPVSCYTRQKGLLFDSCSTLAIRHAVLTSSGFLLIWMKPTKGFTLSLKRAVSIETKTIAMKQRTGRKCLIKIHFCFGTLNFILVNAQIEKWRNLLVEAVDDKVQQSTVPKEPAQLSIMPPPLYPVLSEIKQSRVFISDVVVHPPPMSLGNVAGAAAEDQWRGTWAAIDAITPPSSNSQMSIHTVHRPRMPFPMQRGTTFKIEQPRRQTVSKITRSNIPSVALPVSDSVPSHPIVPTPGHLMDSFHYGGITPFSSPSTSSEDVRAGVKPSLIPRPHHALKRSHTTQINHTVGWTAPIDAPEKKTARRRKTLQPAEAKTSDEINNSQLPVEWLRSKIEKRVRHYEDVAKVPEQKINTSKFRRSVSASSNISSYRAVVENSTSEA